MKKEEALPTPKLGLGRASSSATAVRSEDLYVKKHLNQEAE